MLQQEIGRPILAMYLLQPHWTQWAYLGVKYITPFSNTSSHVTSNSGLHGRDNSTRLVFLIRFFFLQNLLNFEKVCFWLASEMFFQYAFSCDLLNNVCMNFVIWNEWLINCHPVHLSLSLRYQYLHNPSNNRFHSNDSRNSAGRTRGTCTSYILAFIFISRFIPKVTTTYGLLLLCPFSFYGNAETTGTMKRKIIHIWNSLSRDAFNQRRDWF